MNGCMCVVQGKQTDRTSMPNTQVRKPLNKRVCPSLPGSQEARQGKKRRAQPQRLPPVPAAVSMPDRQSSLKIEDKAPSAGDAGPEPVRDNVAMLQIQRSSAGDPGQRVTESSSHIAEELQKEPGISIYKDSNQADDLEAIFEESQALQVLPQISSTLHRAAAALLLAMPNG